jgi:hypothetical protein
LEETIILGGQKGLDHLPRDLFVLERFATFLSILGDEEVVAAVDPQGDLELYVLEGFDGGQLGFEV